MSKKNVDVEELVKLGFPRFLAEAAKELHERGLDKVKPPEDLVWGIVALCEKALAQLPRGRGKKSRKGTKKNRRLDVDEEMSRELQRRGWRGIFGY